MIFALLVSAGLNAGILATLWVTRGQDPPPQPQEGPGPPLALRPGEPPLQFPGEPEHPPLGPRVEPSSGPPTGPSRPSSPTGPPGSPVVLPSGRPPGPGLEGPEDDGPFGGESGEVLPPSGAIEPVAKTPPPRLRELAERLGLSGEKRAQFFVLQLRMIGAMHNERSKIELLRREVRVEMFSARPDRERIEARLAAIQNAQLTLERQTVRTILDTREILDGEAERQYLEFISRLRLGAGEPRPNGGMKRPGPGGRRPPMGVPGMPLGRELPGAPPEPKPNAERPENRTEQPVAPGQDPRMNRPGGRPGGPPGGGGFGGPRNDRRDRRPLSMEERLERRRRIEQWRARQQGSGGPPGGGAAPPMQSDPEGEAPP